MRSEQLNEFKKALHGERGELDAWLEVNDEAECREIFKAIEAECRVPDGYVLVPMEPTASQLDVAVSFALNVRICSDYNWSAYMRDVYARMIAAAPKPEKAEPDCIGFGGKEMKATREQVLAMAREIYGFINTTEEQLANIERLVHLAQQFTLDQLRAQGQRVYMAGSYAKFLDGTSDHIPLGGEVSFVNLNWKNQIELIRIPETLE